LIQRYDITVIPLYVRLGNEEYLNRVNITPEELYRWSDEHGETPKTAAPSIDDITKFFENCGGAFS